MAKCYPDEQGEGWYRVKDLAKGEFIKRSVTAKKVYRKGEYDRQYKAFWLHDYADISVSILVRGTVKVWAGFTY